MKLEKLSKEQESKLKENKDKFIKKFLNSDKIDMKIASELIEFIYSLIGKLMPKIYIAKDPLDAQVLANKLCGTTNKFYNFGTYLTSYWSSFYSYYETFVDFGIITEDKFPKYFKLRKAIEANIFMSIEFDNAIILVNKPLYCHKNDVGLHNLSGKAIEWENGYGQYYINGRSMPSKIFEQEITKECFINESNEDIKAGMYEIIESKGEGSILLLLQANEIDKQSFVHNDGTIEEMSLLKTNELFDGEEDLTGRSPAPLAWLKLTCPSTGTRYIIPSDGSFNNCIDAAKYHRPEYVPTDLEYKWSQRN